MQNKKNNSGFSNYLVMALLGLLIVVLLIFILEITNKTYFFHSRKSVAVTGSQYTKGTTEKASTTQAKNQTSTSNINSSQDSNTVSSDVSLEAPWGTFANVYASNYNEQMGSTCNTTPGATCQIIFTNGNLTRSLKSEVADKGGAVYWSWKPSDINLSSGVWHIMAKAILGSQTKVTNNDPLTLSITP